MQKTIQFDNKKGKRLVCLINKLLSRDRDLFNDFILSKDKIKYKTIIFLFLLLFSILNIVLINSLNSKDDNNFNSKFISINNSFTNFSKKDENDEIKKEISYAINSSKLKTKFKDFSRKRNLLNKSNITIFNETEKSGLNSSIELTNNSLVLTFSNNSITNAQNLLDSFRFNENIIFHVSLVILIIKMIVLILISYNFYVTYRKYKNIKKEEHISKQNISKLDIKTTGKINKKKINTDDKNLVYPNKNPIDLETENDFVIQNKEKIIGDLNEYKKRFLNSKINLIFCFSFFNNFDIFYQPQLMLNYINQRYLKISNSTEEISIFTYLYVFYITIFILYILYFNYFYENILLANFFSFFILQIFDGFFNKNLQLNFIAFFVLWILVFLINKKNTLNQIKIFSNEKKVIYQNLNLESEILQDSTSLTLIINIEKETEISNLNFEETLNNFLENKYLYETTLYDKNEEKNSLKKNQNVIFPNFIINEKVIFTEDLNKFEFNKFLKNDEENRIILDVKNSNFNKSNKTSLNPNFYPKSNDKPALNDLDDFLYDRSNGLNKSSLNKKKSYFDFKENLELVIRNNHDDNLNIDNIGVELILKKLFLLNHKNLLQILYEIKDFNLNLGIKLLDKLQIIINILKNLKNYENKNEMERNLKSYSSINKTYDDKKINNVNNFNSINIQSNENKFKNPDFTINHINIESQVGNNINLNLYKNQIDSENIHLKSKTVLNRLNESIIIEDAIRNLKPTNPNFPKSENTEFIKCHKNIYEELYKELKILFILISEEIQNTKSYIFIGNLVHQDIENNNKDLILSVKFDICKNSKNLILTMINTTYIIKCQEIQSDLKFKNLYLKKFSQEFKNPLLGIKEICKHFYKSFESYNNKDVNNKSKSKNSNISFNISSQCISPISNELMNNKIKDRFSNNVFADNKKIQINPDFDITSRKNSNNLNIPQDKQVQKKFSNDMIFNRESSNRRNKPMNYLNYKTDLKLDSSLFNKDKIEFLKEITNIKNIKYICEYLLMTIADLETLINLNKNFQNINNKDDEFKINSIINENEDNEKQRKSIVNNKDKVILSDTEIFEDNHNLNFKKEGFAQTYNIFIKKNVDKATDFINIRKFINYFIRVFEIKLDLIGKNLDIIYYINNSIPEIIISNEKKLQQIIFNLLSNAIKFTNRGRIGLDLDYNKDTKKLILKIIDSGMGIDPDIIKKVGQPYFKTFHNNNDYGVGMGIFIVKKHVKSLKGEIKIESIKNKGTKIIIELPYNIEANKKAINENEKKVSKKSYILDSSEKLCEVKESNFEKESEDEIKIKVLSESCGNKINKKNYSNSSNISKHIKKSIYTNRIKKNYTNIFNEYENRNKKNLKAKEKFENISSLKIRMPLKEENYKESSEETFKILNNYLNDMKSDKNTSYPISSGTNINVNLNKENSVLKNKDLSSANIKSPVNIKFDKNLCHLSMIFSNNIGCKISNISIKDKHISDNPNKFNEISFEPDKKNSGENLSEKNYFEKDEKISFIIKSDIKKDTQSEAHSFSSADSKVSSSRSVYNIEDSENNFKIQFIKNVSEEINKPKTEAINNQKKNISNEIFDKNFNYNSLIIPEPLEDEKYEKTNLQNLVRDFKKEKSNSKNTENFFMDSSSLFNNSKDATQILDDNLINLYLNALKLEFKEQEIFRVNSVYTIPNKNFLKITNIKKNLIFYNEAEDILKKSKAFIKILNNTNLNVINKDKIQSKEIYTDRINNLMEVTKKINVEKENLCKPEIQRKELNINKIKNLSNLNSPLLKANWLKNQIEKENLSVLRLPNYIVNVVESNKTRKSRKRSFYNMEKSQSSSSRFHPNNKYQNSHEMNNLENKTDIFNKFHKDNKYSHEKIENKLMKNEVFSQINEEKNLLKAYNSYYDNREEELHSSLKYSFSSNFESRKIEIENNILRILVVDDEKLVRRSHINIITKYLEKNKIFFEIEECEDGIDCLYKAYIGINQGFKYDLIITDETMNFMKGSFMAKIFKKLTSENVLYDIKIFMVTSYESDYFSHLQGAIFEDIFTKPLSINNIDKIFNFCLKK